MVCARADRAGYGDYHDLPSANREYNVEHTQAVDHSRNCPQVQPMILRDPVLRDPAGFALLPSRDHSVESFARGFLAEMRAL